MKKFTKLFLSCTAAAALAAAAGTAAMAADFTATYADGTVTISGYETENAQQTLLVLNNDATTVAETDIVQIDQQADDFATIPVGTLTDGTTYYVRIGGTDGTIKTASFTVGAVASTRLLGDVDGNATINTTDASGVVNHVLSTSVLAGEALQAADADDSGVVNTTDASSIVDFVLSNPSNIDGVKTISEKKNPVAE